MRKFSAVVYAVLAIALGLSGTAHAQRPFRSGFESGVTLTPPTAAKGDWVQYLKGADEGSDWASALPERAGQRNRMSYLVSARHPLEDYAVSRIESVTGRDGKPTKALYMELRKEDPSTKEAARVQYGLYPEPAFKQGYVRYWLKLQPDLALSVMPPGTMKARQVMEWKETGKPRADFRWGIYIKRNRSEKDLFWYTLAQFGDLARSPDAWECTSHAPVPVGEWFPFEVFFSLDRKEGRVWASANGKTVVDYTGKTQRDSELFVWWPFKLYVGGALEKKFEGTPLYQWVDDVEFSREPPSPLPPAASESGVSCRTY